MILLYFLDSASFFFYLIHCYIETYMNLFRIFACVGVLGLSVLFSQCPQLIFLSRRSRLGKQAEKLPIFFYALDVFT